MRRLLSESATRGACRSAMEKCCISPLANDLVLFSDEFDAATSKDEHTSTVTGLARFLNIEFTSTFASDQRRNSKAEFARRPSLGAARHLYDLILNHLTGSYQQRSEGRALLYKMLTTRCCRASTPQTSQGNSPAATKCKSEPPSD